MPDRRMLFRRFVTFTFDGVQMKQFRASHLFETAEQLHKILHVMAVEWTEVSDVHTLEDILLLCNQRLQRVVESDEDLTTVFVEDALGKEPSRHFESQSVISGIRVQVQQVLF